MPKNIKKKTKKSPKRKLAIVMSGGGMRCVYGVGVLTALVEEYALTKPDIIVAASGSVANAAYYLSGQYRQMISAWLWALSDKKFVSYTNKQLVNIDYLVDEFFKKRAPFDFVEMKRSRTLFLFAATRVKDGKTMYLKLPKTNAIYEHLRAAKAAPFIYGKEVKLGTSFYIDGDFGANTEDLAKKAVAEGATHLIIVENSPESRNGTLKRAVLKALYYRKKIAGKPGIAKALLRELATPISFKAPPHVRHVTLSPSKALRVGFLEQRRSHLRQAFNTGYADATGSAELKKLLKSTG